MVDNLHYKGIYKRAAWIGDAFQASKYMNGYHFHFKNISMGLFGRNADSVVATLNVKITLNVIFLQ